MLIKKSRLKRRLPSLRNQDWEKVNVENEKINKLLPNIPTDNITELKELRYSGMKLVCDKISVPLRNSNRNTKPGWEIRLEVQVKKFRQVKMLRREIIREHASKCREEKTKKKAGKSNHATWRDKSKDFGEKRTKRKQRRIRGKGDLHYIDQYILKENNVRQKNMAIA